ncbi:MAG TPA: ribose-phosphate diphosphokinase [Acidimicrobiia bacterium]|nr:ribose-phosphate diphosphokinase [Acidimicrobiia bacterium]
MTNDDEILLFAGNGSKILGQRIADELRIDVSQGDTSVFPDGNLFVKVGANVRGRHVYLVQSTVFPSNDNFMELLFWIDAFKRASAESVTVVIPYFSYAKGDKKDEPRVSIRARVCADAIESAGADRVVAMDLHAPQIQGFFRIPVDNLYGMPVLCDQIEELDLENLVVVSPDAGFARQARRFGATLSASVAIADKERRGHDQHPEVLRIMGEVEAKTALIVDDFTLSTGTLVSAAEELMRRGAATVYALVTHGVFAEGSMERLDDSPIVKLFVTDTVENQPVTFSEKVDVVSVAPLFAEAITRIHHRASISELFPG